MQAILDTPDVGVIVGRFQVHELHSEHKKLIDTVCETHDKVVIFLGLSPLINSSTDPLDFEARKQMILEEYPEVNVLYIKDAPSDLVWCQKLDSQIRDLLHANQTAMLYGGRDSFIKHYDPDYGGVGRFPTTELEPEVIISGTVLRKAIAGAKTKALKAFREGVVWASQARFATPLPTVDIAPFRITEGEIQILMGRKLDETGYRFIGGFVDPEEDDSFEDAARRETREESGVELGDLYYAGNCKVDDWRYRGTRDKIFTTMYIAKHKDGTPVADDDLAELKWFTWSELFAWSDKQPKIVETHVPLLKMLQTGARNVPAIQEALNA